MASHPAARWRVLVVDDEPPIRELLREALTMWGYAADVAPDGTAALGRLEDGSYNLVVTDLAMPGASGWEVVEAVQARNLAAAVVVMTGSPTRGDGDRARERGVALLEKPFQLHELRTVIREALVVARAGAGAGR